MTTPGLCDVMMHRQMLPAGLVAGAASGHRLEVLGDDVHCRAVQLHDVPVTRGRATLRLGNVCRQMQATTSAIRCPLDYSPEGLDRKICVGDCLHHAAVRR